MIGLPALSAAGLADIGWHWALPCHQRSVASLLLPPASASLMKSWTTTEQLLWLEGRVSDWQKSRQCNQVAVFLAETVTKFSKKFSVPESEQSTVNAVSWFLCL